jgi:N-acetylglucosaminyldiphosphoundecaprenol N-acetyl-beta-D-mannosaminyltransferase
MNAASALRRAVDQSRTEPETLFEREVHCLLGLPFDAIDLDGAVAAARDAVLRGERCVVSTPNLNFAVACRQDPLFRDSVINSDLSVVDGMPLVWIARLLGVPIRERVAGSDLFERLRQGRARRMSVYFFGGAAGAAQAACERINAQDGGLIGAGFESPGFGSVAELSRDESIAKINASGADFLVVSLGARKGQAWIERNRARISVPVISHLGAVVNFAAGTVHRAPPWMQRSGLEWLWRIKEEQSLWRRYLSDGLALLGLLATRVLPLAWMLHRRRPPREELERASIHWREAGEHLLIRLRGAWIRENLAPLRERLAAAAASRRHVRIDLERVSFVDTAVLGLLMLSYGTQRKHALRMTCSRPSPKVRRLFVWSCAEFLLESAPVAVDAAEADALELAEPDVTKR